jgi:pimeloyl-ACP methyl ester carboxylesterase
MPTPTSPTSIPQRVADGIIRLYDPLSQAVLPLVDGVSRRLLSCQGVQQRSCRVAGINTNFYYTPGCPASERSGQAMPVLLLHGIADNALTWLWQMPALRNIGPVYALDLPGFGLSGCPPGQSYAPFDDLCVFLETFLERVIGAPALVVGNSLGGWLAVRLAWTLPHLVRGLVLINAGGAWLEGRYSWEPFVEMIKMPDLRTVQQVYRQMFGQVFWKWPLYLGLRSFQARFRCQAVHLFVNAFTGEEFLHPQDLHHLPVPAGLVWGLADFFLPAGSHEFFQEHLWNAPQLQLPGCGHLPQREQPRRVNQFIRTFAAKLEISPPYAPAVATSHAL